MRRQGAVGGAVDRCKVRQRGRGMKDGAIEALRGVYDERSWVDEGGLVFEKQSDQSSGPRPLLTRLHVADWLRIREPSNSNSWTTVHTDNGQHYGAKGR